MTIDILPEDVLLEIFDHYVAQAYEGGEYEEWQMLVHVCRKWRYAVFRSPLRLNLRILCIARTPVKEKLAVWPALPIIVEQKSRLTTYGEDNIVAALGHNDRVCRIDVDLSYPLQGRVLSAMQKTFLGLKDLSLYLDGVYDMAFRVPDSFLGGSAPDLRRLKLTCIPFPFPVIRKLLLSAPNLVILSLHDIPPSGYFLPEAMVICLSALTRLKILFIGFEFPGSHPSLEGRRPPPTHTVLPALTGLEFVGFIDYLEDLVARIDAPLLNRLYIRLSRWRPTTDDTPKLTQFLSRAPKLKACDKACVTLYDSYANFAVLGRDNLGLDLQILFYPLPARSMTHLCNSSFPQALIPMLETLYILSETASREYWQILFTDYNFLDLFRPFTTVKNLYLTRGFVPPLASALQELDGERLTEVLPNLQCIFVEDLPDQESEFVPEAMRQFIAARQLSYHPITISPWIPWIWQFNLSVYGIESTSYSGYI